MKLRYYQQEAIDETLKWLDTQQTHPLIVLPTGSGKTVVFTTIIKQLFDRDPNCRVLILAHRQELVSQAKDKLLSVWPCAPYGILAAGLKEFDASSPVVMQAETRWQHPRDWKMQVNSITSLWMRLTMLALRRPADIKRYSTTSIPLSTMRRRYLV